MQRKQQGLIASGITTCLFGAALMPIGSAIAADSVHLNPGMWSSTTQYRMSGHPLPPVNTPARCLRAEDAEVRPAQMLQQLLEQSLPWRCTLQQQHLDGPRFTARFACSTAPGGRFNGAVDADIQPEHYQASILGQVTPVDGDSGKVLSTTMVEVRGAFNGRRSGACAP